MDDRYSDLTACMHSISLEELIMAVRRQSQGFSRGSSTYRGVTHHPSGEGLARDDSDVEDSSLIAEDSGKGECPKVLFDL